MSKFTIFPSLEPKYSKLLNIFGGTDFGSLPRKKSQAFNFGKYLFFHF